MRCHSRTGTGAQCCPRELVLQAFDTLNRLVNVRLSGKINSDETQKEKRKP
jgi:hypothetical protein